MRVVPEEAALIHHAAERITAGVKPYRIAADWNDRGIVTSYGNRWKPAYLRRMLIRGHLTGRNGHPAILPEDE